MISSPVEPLNIVFCCTAASNWISLHRVGISPAGAGGRIEMHEALGYIPRQNGADHGA